MKYFFDVGANVGQTFDWHLLEPDKREQYLGWKVVCFEPSPRHWSGLLTRCDQPDVREYFEVVLCPCAIGPTAGLVPLFEKDDPRGDSLHADLWLGEHYVANRPQGRTIVCPSIPLSQAILHLTKPGDEVVVKLDCEGAEYGIITETLENPTALARTVGWYVEWHCPDLRTSRRAQEVDLCQRLERAGKWVITWPH